MIFKRSARFFLAVIILAVVPGGSLMSGAVYSQEKNDAKEKESAGKDDETDASKSRVFGFDAGIQGSYSTGLSTSSFYYQPFANIYLKHKYVKFNMGISRFQNCQIADGEGEFENVNYTQPKLALSIYPHRMVEFFGEYYYSTGDRGKHYYRSHEGTAGFLLDFEVVTLGTTVTKSKTGYHFKSDDRKDKTFMVYKSSLSPTPRLALWARWQYYDKRYVTRMEDLDAYPELSWFVHETTSIDAKYEYRENIFEYVPEDFQYHHERYYSHTGRLGVFSEPWRYFSFQAGVTAGQDSEKYIIAGGDVTVNFNILDYVKISSTYTPEFYKAPKVNATQQKIIEVISMILAGKRRSRNPFLRMSDVGKSFWNHGVSFSVMYTY
jgi:hypothetical protein